MAATVKVSCGNGIASFTAAWVNSAGTRTPPVSGFNTYYSGTVLTGIDCDRVVIQTITLANGYTYPWTAAYSGTYTCTSHTAENGYPNGPPTVGYSSELGLVIYPETLTTITLGATAEVEEVYPEAPSSGYLTVAETTETTLTFHITPLDDADYYQIAYRPNNTTSSTLCYTNNLPSNISDQGLTYNYYPTYKITGLTPGTTYVLNYRGVNGTGDGSFMATGETTSTKAAQAQFTEFSRTHNSITVHFNATNADMYYLRWRVYDATGTGSTQWQDYNNGERFSGTFVTLKNLSAGIYYEFQCRGYYSTTSLTGDWSTQERITTRPSAANTITSIATKNSLTVTCGAVTGAEAYLLTCGDASIIVNPTLSTTVTSFSHTFANLDADTSYAISYCAITYLDDDAFDIDASDGYHDGAYYITGEKSSTTGTTLKKIGKAAITGFTRNVNSIYLTFAADEATMYYVEYKKSSEATWMPYNTNGFIATPYCTISSLSAGTYYDFRVFGSDDNYNTGAYSDVVSITTKPETGAISVYSKTSTSITVTCSKITSADAYLLTCGDTTYITDPVLSSTDTSFTYTFENLSAGTEYTIDFYGIVYLATKSDSEYAYDYQWPSGYHDSTPYLVGSSSSVTITTKPSIGKAEITGFVRGVDSIRISLAATDATYCEVAYRKLGAASAWLYKNYVDVTAGYCDIDELSPGTYYEFFCYGHDGGSNVGENSDIVAITTKPAAASAISVDSTTKNSIIITCPVITSTDAYLLKCGDDKRITDPVLGSTETSFQYTFDELEASTEYTITYCGITYLDPEAFDSSVYDDKNGSVPYVTGAASETTAKTKALIAKWDWKIANGNVSDPDNAATATQTQTAKSVIDGQGLISSFSRKVWNDMCDKVNEIAKAAGKSWLDAYATFDSTKMTATDRTLTAKRFNSLNHNVNSYQATGITEQVAKSKANPVRGPFFVTIMSKANDWIDTL